MTSRKLIRAMCARRSSVLGCGHHVLAGALIAWLLGQGWVWTPCRLDQLRDLDETMRELARPSGRGDTADKETT